MSILGLIAAFGGGVFAAAIGAVPAFIMTGVFSIVGAVAGMCGAADASNILINYFAFGSFFGPHIAFAGGVAAAAYAKKKGVSENGADIVSALAGLNEPDVRLVFGGKFKTGSEFMSKGKNFTTTLVIAFSYSLVVAGLYAAAVSAGVSLFFSTLVPFSKVPYIFP